jgi:hypothetical protein
MSEDTIIIKKVRKLLLKKRKKIELLIPGMVGN